MKIKPKIGTFVYFDFYSSENKTNITDVDTFYRFYVCKH